MNKTTEVRFFGGLGNQIFQMIAGIYAAELRQTNLIIDTRWIDNNFGHQRSNVMDFDWKKSPIVRRQVGDLSKIQYKSLSMINRLIYRKLFPTRALGFLTNIDLLETSHWESARRVRLHGYFQDLRIWRSMQMNHDSFFVLRNPSRRYEDFSTVLGNNFISVHIRGGDFLQKSNFYENVKQEYYESAMVYALDIYPNLPLVVFTDDFIHTQKMLGAIGVKPHSVMGTELSAAENMKLMSKGRVIISANSTFSLWAGLMAMNCSVIVSPSKWFVDESRTTENLVPQHWIRL